MENANLLKAPDYGLVNLNVHYDTEITHDYLKGAIFFFEIKNVLNKPTWLLRTTLPTLSAR